MLGEERRNVVPLAGVVGLDLPTGWRRVQLNDAGRDSNGNVLVEVVDRKVWERPTTEELAAFCKSSGIEYIEVRGPDFRQVYPPLPSSKNAEQDQSVTPPI